MCLAATSKPNRRRVANVEKAKSLNLSLGLLRARFAKFVSARKNDVLVSRSRLSGHTSAGRPRYPIMHDNSKTQAPSMPLVPIDTIFSRRAANAVAFGATMCNYSFVWYKAILAETARARMEGAIRRLARWRAAGWKNLPLSGSPRS